MHPNYQLFYSSEGETRHGVGFISSEETAERIEHVHNTCERITSLSLNTGTTKISLIQVYATQQWRAQQEKDDLYQQLLQVKSILPYADNVIPLMHLNGHVGQDRDGVRDVVGAVSIGTRNRDGEKIIVLQ